MWHSQVHWYLGLTLYVVDQVFELSQLNNWKLPPLRRCLRSGPGWSHVSHHLFKLSKCWNCKHVPLCPAWIYGELWPLSFSPLSFDHVGYRTWAQVIRLASKQHTHWATLLAFKLCTFSALGLQVWATVSGKRWVPHLFLKYLTGCCGIEGNSCSFPVTLHT